MDKTKLDYLIGSYIIMIIVLIISVAYNTKLPMNILNSGSVVGFFLFIVSLGLFIYAIKDDYTNTKIKSEE